MNCIAPRVFGLALVAGGLALGGWVAYHLLAGTPEFAGGSSGRGAIRTLLFGVVLGASGFVLLKRGGRACTPRAEQPAPRPDERALGEIRSLAEQGRKIEAIKQYRHLTGAGLAESKQAVEELERRAA